MNQFELEIESAIKEVKNKAIELKKDFKNGAWQVPVNKVGTKQAEYRALKLEFQFLDEKRRAYLGNENEKKNLLPLVLRREHLNYPDEDSGWKADGNFFTFAEPIFTEVEGEICGCGLVDPDVHTEQEIAAHLQNGRPQYTLDGVIQPEILVCKKLITSKRKVEIHQVQHVRGSWLCRGCLLSIPEAGITMQEDSYGERNIREKAAQLNFFNPERQLRWCPNFIVELGGLGPLGYRTQLKDKVCYAGLLHSQCNVTENSYEMVWLCDTCGYRQSEKKELGQQAVKPGTTLIDGMHTAEAAEIIDALNQPPQLPEKS